jgi:hypothetical protein
MSAGISRVHGTVALPSQRPSTITFYQITLTTATDLTTSTYTGVDGLWDRIFRIAVDQFATVAMIGTPVTTGSVTTCNFAIEDTGVDVNSPTGLGLGSSEGNSYGSTALALTAAIKALGTVNSFNLNTSNTAVAAGVNGAAF